MNALPVTQKLSVARSGWLLSGLILIYGGCPIYVSANEVFAASGDHTCATVFGRLQCWGKNDRGQLGNGTQVDSAAPTPVISLLTADTVAVGRAHTCAIRDGGLYCWGYNGHGQLGNGSVVDASSPVLVPDLQNGVTAVAAGMKHTCAVVNAGLKCWGDNAYGQLGTGNTQSWTSPLDVYPPGSGVTAVSGGELHSCAVVNSEARCWGWNGYGQLGNNSTIDSPEPVAVAGPIDNAMSVATGKHHSCATLTTGAVRCWGGNTHGQLGNGTFVRSMTPVTVSRGDTPAPVPLSAATSVAAGGGHTCAATSSGSYCWGYNEGGQLGIDTTQDLAFAMPIDDLGIDVNAVAAGDLHSCAMVSGKVNCWGSNEFGQLGNAAASAYVPTPAEVFAELEGVSAGHFHSCAVSGGGAFCWGSNRNGQLGTGTLTNSELSQDVTGLGPGSNVAAAAAGGFHSCALLGNGTVHCWGNGRLGQLGNPTTTQSVTPVAVVNMNDAIGIAVGTNHTCAVLSAGAVQCWGSNSSGELGDGTTDNSSLPVTVEVGSPFPVPLSGAIAVTAAAFSGDGSSHSCAVVNAGAYCWGQNEFGQLGEGSENDSHRAVVVATLGPGSGVTMISAGAAHTCAVVASSIRCWGRNSEGQLGNGTSDNSLLPVSVSGLTDGVSAVASGTQHTCAIVDGGVECWGNNDRGQLGDGSFLDSHVPVTAIPAGSGMTTLTAGDGYTCATTDASLTTTSCWGSGMYGRLGNGIRGYSPLPVAAVDTIAARDFELP
jgi:alpha-tubulin suppressor-like RCC1 family protein